MPAFRFFDPWAPLENADQPAPPANRANPAKAAIGTPASLATLAGLAASPGGTIADGTRRASPWGAAKLKHAAIREVDDGIPRAWTEGFARLDPDWPPGDVPPQRWGRFVDDVGLFLDQWGSRAAALGWEAHALFGCDPARPFARVDQAGLLWLLNGCRLVALAADAAVIETATGARQTYRRPRAEPGRMLAWDLVSPQNRSG